MTVKAKPPAAVYALVASVIGCDALHRIHSMCLSKVQSKQASTHDISVHRSPLGATKAAILFLVVITHFGTNFGIQWVNDHLEAGPVESVTGCRLLVCGLADQQGDASWKTVPHIPRGQPGGLSFNLRAKFACQEKLKPNAAV